MLGADRREVTLTRFNAYMVVEAGRDLDAGEVVSCLVPERLAR